MTGGEIIWLDESPRIEERDGVFILSLKSGGTVHSFAAPPRLAYVLGGKVTEAVQIFHARKAKVIAFPAEGEAKPRRSKSKKEGR